MSRLFRKSKRSKADDPRLRAPGLGKGLQACQARAGTWPARYGPVAGNSRASEPLVSAPWKAAWKAPLNAAKQPEALLLGLGHALVQGGEDDNGEFTIRVWDGKGRQVGDIESGYSVCVLDLDAERLIGTYFGFARRSPILGTIRVDNAQKDAVIPKVGPYRSVISHVLKGPNVTIFVDESGWVPFPDGDAYNVDVTSLGIFDYSKKDSVDWLDEVVKVARMSHSLDPFQPRVAASDAGPVFATGGGILWTDWYLNARYEFLQDMIPLAMSVDENGTAYVVRSRKPPSDQDRDERDEDEEDEDEDEDERDRKPPEDNRCFLAIIPPGGPVAHEVELPWGAQVKTPPPILSSACDIYLTPPGEVLALNPQGRTRWRRRRTNKSPGIVTGNGLLLVAMDQELVALDREGEQHLLWRLPAPTYTAPILGNGRMHVATADTLYVLEPE